KRERVFIVGFRADQRTCWFFGGFQKTRSFDALLADQWVSGAIGTDIEFPRACDLPHPRAAGDDEVRAMWPHCRPAVLGASRPSRMAKSMTTFAPR
ncbi:MAG: hypothetical protein OSB69_16235, partial [Alphaproteobacteria bacterium]|nr:hypothetical protein [Alphaproteobacteria bacterium]